MKKILIPIPDIDFDPTEVAIPWQIFDENGFEIIFATQSGQIGKCDQIMLDGRGLDIWGPIPFLRNFVLFGRILRANSAARNAYNQMQFSNAFKNPIKWDDIENYEFDGLFIPGGHRARGMRPFLESKILQDFIAKFVKTQKPIGAVCHGPLLLARTIAENGKSILYGRKCTALTWSLEKSANDFGNILRWWDKDYYRTYNEENGEEYGRNSVESEMKSLIGANNFILPPTDSFKINSGLFRDKINDDSAAFIVQDQNLVTGRWPGDIHKLAKRFVSLFA